VVHAAAGVCRLLTAVVLTAAGPCHGASAANAVTAAILLHNMTAVAKHTCQAVLMQLCRIDGNKQPNT
jgi:hypothetical protein